MNFPNLTFWSNLLGTVGIEVCAVVALGVAAQLAFRRAYWKRAMWQMALLSLILISASEWTGAGRGAVSSIFGKKRIEQTNAPLPVSSSAKFYTTISPVASPLPPPQKPVWWPGLIWLAGIVIVLGRMTTAQGLLFLLRFRREKIVDGDLQERVAGIAKLLGLRRKVCLLRLPESISPMAFGILFPTIGLPPEFETAFSAVEQDAILAHELAHLAALDPLWFRLADFASALLWWHPLAWCARRSLHGASELAADEATALVPDGPGSLAHCLVSLGKKMTVSRGWGWTGINGGFRSKLGKRVERLTHLSPGHGRPFVGWRDKLVRIVATILIVPSVILLFGAFQTAKGEKENAWRNSWNSSPGMLLAMAAVDTTENQTKDKEIATRIMDAKLYYEMGKLDVAKAILTQILKDDPSNGSATYYMDLIKETQLAKNAEAKITTVGRDSIISKLNTLTMDSVEYELPLTSVLARLRVWSQKADSTGLGIKFLIDGYDDNYTAMYVLPNPHTDMGSVNIKITPALHNLRLNDILNAIVMTADHPIEYTIKDYGVVFSPKPATTLTLYSKAFHVDPTAFVMGLQQATGMSLNPGTHTSDNAAIGSNITIQLDTIVRTCFTSLGVNLTDPGKSFFFNPHAGLFLVRATAGDLQLVQQGVNQLNQTARQITIEGRFVELPKEETKALGINLDKLDGDARLITVMSDKQFRAALDYIKNKSHADLLAAPKVTTLSGRQARISSTNDSGDGPALDVIATVREDGFSIQTLVIASFTEHGQKWEVTEPSFRLIDGQTLVMGQLLTEPVSGAKKWRIVFVTPTIIDAVGNRVHSDEELSNQQNHNQ